MVFFLGGVVNPSSLEISAAIATWTAGAVLVTERLEAPPRGLVAVLGTSATVFELSRSLSPFWLALTAVFLLASADRKALRVALRDRAVRGWLGCVVLFGGVALWWIIAVHATDVIPVSAGVPSSVSSMTIVTETLRRNVLDWIPTIVGVFGWYDVHAPTITYVIWFLLVAVVLGGAVAVVGRWRAAVLLAFLAAIVVVPAAISASHARVDGYLWSGRDTMPFALGLPILAAAHLGTSRRAGDADRLATRWLPATVTLTGVAEVGSFFVALRRWVVGTNGPHVSFLFQTSQITAVLPGPRPGSVVTDTLPSWHPAVGVVGALVLELVSSAALWALFVGLGHGESAFPLLRLFQRRRAPAAPAPSSVSAAFGAEGA